MTRQNTAGLLLFVGTIGTIILHICEQIGDVMMIIMFAVIMMLLIATQLGDEIIYSRRRQ